ncbi:MAG: hypothetical protein IKV27_02705 [Lachnospiraceae bacterium]|nr:hypothetical protein [Lachnospiraceae bacterium]
MRKIAVPITSRLLTLENKSNIVNQLRKMEAEYVLIGIGSVKVDASRRQEELELLKESCAFFEKHGFKTGIWLWSFSIPEEVPYQRMISLDGVTSEKICPLDEDFTLFYEGYIRDIVQHAKPHVVLLDDDFSMGRMEEERIACVCPMHLERISQIVGEVVGPEGLEEKFFTGKANKYRDAYIQAMRETLIDFADRLRNVVDQVDPSVRMGVCSLMSAWNMDGVSSYEIAKHLAGGNKPFVRLIGAPYWAVDKVYNDRLQDVINLQRIEASWRDEDVEVLCEGDVYPRPRYATPSNYLEAYDMALLADGTADGIIKYVIDYYSPEGYESGYIDRHLKNAPNYEWIMKNMRSKTNVGVRVYEFMHTIKSTNLPETYAGHKFIQNRYSSPASKMMSACSIPITYSGDGCCGVAFGENVRYLSEEQLKGGLITDAGGAKVLAELGIDTGIIAWEGSYTPIMEYYHTEEKHVSLRGTTVQKAILAEGAVLQSSFVCGKEKIPASFLYTNDKGYRFLIFTFDSYTCDESVYRQYTCGRQLMNAPEVLTGNKLPVKIGGHPDLYVLATEDENSLSVGLWNLFADSVFEPVVQLSEEFEEIECCNCTASLKGDKVILSDIAPYGFAAFTVKRK